MIKAEIGHTSQVLSYDRLGQQLYTRKLVELMLIRDRLPSN